MECTQKEFLHHMWIPGLLWCCPNFGEVGLVDTRYGCILASLRLCDLVNPGGGHV